MEESDSATDAGGTTIGLLGASPAVRARLENRRVLEGREAIAANEPDVIVTVGESALGERLELETGAPTLPIDVGAGVRSSTEDAVDTALEVCFDGEAERVDHPILTVSIDGMHHGRALFDVTLVSDRPAHISGFRVTQREESVLDVRADGVVVATPAGSHGYARAAGGVRVSTGTDALAIVPISAFATSDERWITPVDPLTVSVEREDTPVDVRADDLALGTVSGGATVEIVPDGSITTLVPPQSQSDEA